MLQWGIQPEESDFMLSASFFANELRSLAGVAPPSCLGFSLASLKAGTCATGATGASAAWTGTGSTATSCSSSCLGFSLASLKAGTCATGATGASAAWTGTGSTATSCSSWCAGSALPTEAQVPNDAALALTTCASKEIFVQIRFRGSTAKGSSIWMPMSSTPRRPNASNCCAKTTPKPKEPSNAAGSNKSHVYKKRVVCLV
mmetsp:Transcript_176506/g.565914  ORF Transcript_176506/g.565914 Transcript_176506/m.565914 type:complete len:202 (-) Transcript_176506:201-806(-)